MQSADENLAERDEPAPTAIGESRAKHIGFGGQANFGIRVMNAEITDEAEPLVFIQGCRTAAAVKEEGIAFADPHTRKSQGDVSRGSSLRVDRRRQGKGYQETQRDSIHLYHATSWTPVPCPC